jgi:L-ribulokinase
MEEYVIGLDYGTNSARAVIVNANTGKEVATHVYAYKKGEAGILLDHKKPQLARQHPQEYFDALDECILKGFKKAKAADKKFSPMNIIGIGIDTTGSTPIPVNAEGTPLAMTKEFNKNIHAMAWLWKDKTSHQVAETINRLGHENNPDYTLYSGKIYSAEWYFSKIGQIAIEAPEVYKASASFVEHCDLMPAYLVGETNPKKIWRSACAAGHKAMFNMKWNGLPAQDFFSKLGRAIGVNDRLDDLHTKLYSPDRVKPADFKVGTLRKNLADKYGMSDKVAIAAGAFDAHMGAVGAGIKDGILTKIMGTSTCDMLIGDASSMDTVVEGICGQVLGSIVPGKAGFEAGQSSAGDTFAWLRDFILRAKKGIPDNKPLNATEKEKETAYIYLTGEAKKYSPEEVRMVALDYFNGVRTPDANPNARGAIIGLDLLTKPGALFRAIVESVALGAFNIVERIRRYHLPVNQVIACGGLTKSDFVMQIHSDVFGMEFKVAKSALTCSLGAGMFGAVAAGKYKTVESAQEKMGCGFSKTYKPDMKKHEIYMKKFAEYLETRKNVDNITAHLLKI